ncbi:MAG TPA: tail fiber domain-containing protein [Blastocatellia bacterium]|nr:tail fiber domain-containing protein [Blastocatellia bacterium]
MKGSKISVITFSVLLQLIWLMAVTAVAAQTTAFTYQGRLTDDGNPADAIFEMQFKLFDSADFVTGNQVGATVTNLSVQVTNGVFAVQLDFGAGVFDGSPRFLEISLRPAGSPAAFTVLSPRQPVASAPYAIRSQTATNASQLGGIAPSGFIQNSSSQQASTNFNISGSGTVGGLLSATTINATTQYNINGSRVLGAAGTNNLFVGVGAGASNTTGTNNAFVGRSAGFFNTAGDGNSFFGASAGQNNTTVDGNSFFGASAGFSNTTGFNNSFFGLTAGFSNTVAINNSFFGSSAGFSNTTGPHNSYFGAGAGQANTSGGNNSFFGAFAGTATMSFNNSFFGSNAGAANVSGDNNSFFGAGAGQSNTTAQENAFFGAQAGFSNTEGLQNSFFGSAAGPANTTGDFNSFFGFLAGRFTNTGNNNSFFGRQAGQSNTAENDNTFVGALSDGSAGITNASAVGFRAKVTQSNSLVLGSVNGVNGATATARVGIGNTAPVAKLHIETDTTDAGDNTAFFAAVNIGPNPSRIHFGASGDWYIRSADSLGKVILQDTGGNVGIGTASPADKLQVAGNVRVGTGTTGCVRDADATVIAGVCSSDARLKREITPFSSTLDRLIKLRPVHFYWNAEQFPERGFGNRLSFGLIAQEVEQVLPELVTTDESGYKAVRYNKLPLLLLQAVKDLKADNEALRERLIVMSERLNALEREMRRTRP